MKQVIVVRKDLNMRKGKMAAQAAHASVASVLEFGDVTAEYLQDRFGTCKAYMRTLDSKTIGWLAEGMKKIVVGVSTEKDLLDVIAKAKEAGLSVYPITDAGHTEFKEPTLTCAAIGPDEDAKVDAITGTLVLL